MKVMVGGTFDPIHDGHRLLISRAFDVAGPEGEVTIGLTSNRFLYRKSHTVRPYEIRRDLLEEFLNLQFSHSSWRIEELHDKYGSSLDADFDAIIVSEETFPVAQEINRIRRDNKKPCVEIHQIRCVLAEDGKWISSTRIYRGEIDEHGNLIKKLLNNV